MYLLYCIHLVFAVSIYFTRPPNTTPNKSTKRTSHGPTKPMISFHTVTARIVSGLATSQVVRLLKDSKELPLHFFWLPDRFNPLPQNPTIHLCHPRSSLWKMLLVLPSTMMRCPELPNNMWRITTAYCYKMVWTRRSM